MTDTHSSKTARILAGLGAVGAFLTVLGHFVMPLGFPEGGDAADQVGWILENSLSIRLGAILGLVGAMMMLTFGPTLGQYVGRAGRELVIATGAALAVSATGVVVALGYLMMIVTTWAGTIPTGGAITFVPAMLSIGIHLAVSGWVLALPAAAGTASLVRTRRVIGVSSIVTGVALAAALVLPAVAWVPGLLWFLVVGVGVAATPDINEPEPQRTSSAHMQTV